METVFIYHETYIAMGVHSTMHGLVLSIDGL